MCEVDFVWLLEMGLRNQTLMERTRLGQSELLPRGQTQGINSGNSFEHE